MATSSYYIVRTHGGDIKVMSGAYLSKRIGVTPKRTSQKLKEVLITPFAQRKKAELAVVLNLPPDTDSNWVQVNSKITSEAVRNFIKYSIKFDWFISRWFGESKPLELRKLAVLNQWKSLNTELEEIWFRLPDHIFNIMEMPDGWNEFLIVMDSIWVPVKP